MTPSVSRATTRAELPALLGRAAGACRDAVGGHIELAQPDLRFQQQVLFTVAVLESSSARTDLENADLRLIRSAASDGAAVCRTERPNDAMRAVAASLDEVVNACDALLDQGATVDEWQRFLFADVDVLVSRLPRVWRVRAGARAAADAFLDVALGEVLTQSSHRIGQLTVQILDWYANDDR
jgi:hypothetical protein